MKKLFLTALVCLALAVQAQQTSFIDSLRVTINGETTPPQETTIYFEKNTTDDYYTLSLNNFVLSVEEDANIYVGNIVMSEVTVTENAQKMELAANQTITIARGDLEGVQEEEWFGPQLGNVPVQLTGEIVNDKMYVSIDIDMQEALAQVISVVFGTQQTVTNLTNSKVDLTKPVNVYNIQGVLVRQNALAIDALNDLENGIYIVNGQKIIKQ